MRRACRDELKFGFSSGWRQIGLSQFSTPKNLNIHPLCIPGVPPTPEGNTKETN